MSLSKYFLASIVILAASANIAAENLREDKLAEGLRLYEEPDYRNALKALLEATEDGNLEAMYMVGTMYSEGKGVNVNKEEAAYWFRKAGRNGFAAAQYETGRCFENGIGVLPDQRVAAEWYWRAAQQGHPMACYMLAHCYREGKGMPKDSSKAYRYMKIAADAGLTEAKNEIASMPAPPKAEKVTAKGKQKKAATSRPSRTSKKGKR